MEGTLQWGARGFSGSGFCNSFTLLRSMLLILPRSAFDLDHKGEPCTATILAMPRWSWCFPLMVPSLKPSWNLGKGNDVGGNWDSKFG